MSAEASIGTIAVKAIRNDKTKEMMIFMTGHPRFIFIIFLLYHLPRR